MSDMNVGIQLYSVREPLAEDFKGTLRELAKLGYAGVEFAFYYGDMEPAELSAVLKDLGLSAIGIYEGVGNICDSEAAVYAYATELGCEHLTFGLGPKELNSDFSGCLDTCAAALQTAMSHGRKLCYHAHAHEFAKLDGTYQLDLILGDPLLQEMLFEADTCWIYKGGEDVIGYMETYAERIPLLHVKDVTEDGAITEVGNGVIDFRAVVDFARRRRIPWLSYEQDTTDLPGLESARISIENLKKCF